MISWLQNEITFCYHQHVLSSPNAGLGENLTKVTTEIILNNNNNNYRSGGGISNFGAGCGTVITFVLSAAIAGAFGLEGIALIIVFIILGAIIGGCIAWFFDEIGF